MQKAVHMVVRRWWFGVFIAGALIAVLAEPKAQPATGDAAQILAADEALNGAMRTGDKSIARRLLSLEFTFVDETGKIHERKDFLASLKDSAPASASDATVKIYGLVATVTGNHKSTLGQDAFFLDIWVKQRRSWRALLMQDVVLAPAGQTATDATIRSADGSPYVCKNPCQTVPYRVRSPAEQDVVNSFQAMEKAAIAHDAGEWSKHMADEFVLYRSGRAPIAKSSRAAAIEQQKQNGAVVKAGEVQTMRLAVYGDGAAMTATQAMPDNPPYRTARVWVKRNGLWQLTISVQTDVRNP